MLVMPNHCRVAIAGASALRGKELAALLDERGFPSTDVRLLDDEVAEGALTEAGGEPVVIQGVDEDSFRGVRFVFFAGTRDFTRLHWRQASHAGATLIDLTGALREHHAVPFIPALRAKLPPPQVTTGKLLSSPPAATIIACTIAAALREIAVNRLVLVFFQPVSERGQQAVEELESQAINLLSMKPFTQEVFGAQVAFNLLGSYGEESRERLADVAGEIASQAADYLAGRVSAPAVQLIQAPVFYGCAFTAYVETAAPCDPGEIERALEALGAKIGGTLSDAPSNVSVAGESQISIGRVEPDVNHTNGLWLWGAADNMRLAASNAVSIAETLLAS